MHSLAFAVHAGRGVYALLLGSGVSRAAKIPTGWEITLDLIRGLADLSNESPASLEAWYREKHGKEPDYSALLEDLAKTGAERQQLLRQYVEPTAEEREQGEKAPTAAHRAIARLAANGYVKVIITTNFDRLLESALREAGVEPHVISTDDQVKGAVPIVHAPCTVLKLHGDYLDTRIRNTPKELEKYSEEYDRLLDRIFDEFGLIVCGWSAEWDTALGNAIHRAASRRYTTYWAVHGNLGNKAEVLIAHREAETIAIQDADSFFGSLAEHVESIEAFSKPHPLSTQLTVERAKGYLLNEQHDIRLHDLVNELVERIVRGLTAPAFSVDVPVDEEELNARMPRYGALCEPLVAVAAVAGRWVQPRHHSLWAKVLGRLMTVPQGSLYNTAWADLWPYPATLLLYSLGIGAVADMRLHLLGELLALPTADQEQCVAGFLAPPFLGERGFMQQLDGMSQRPLPLNEWVFEALRGAHRSTLADDSAYERAFDQLEILLALSFATQVSEPRLREGGVECPPGCYIYTSRQGKTQRLLGEIEKSINELGESSPYVESTIFGNTPHECRERLSALSKYIDDTPRRLLWA